MSRNRFIRRTSRALAATALAGSLLAVAGPVTAATAAPGSSATAAPRGSDTAGRTGGRAVFTMTNAASGNQVLAYHRDRAGQLRLEGTYATGGRGSGLARLSSQNSVVLTPDGRFLVVTDVGSDQVSVFRVHGATLELVQVQATGGTAPDSIAVHESAVHGSLVYVLNKGGTGIGSITGFHLTQDGHLRPVPSSTRPLSAAASNAAQVGITPDGGALVVTEEATNTIDTWPLDAEGRPGARTSTPAAGVTPFGFDVTDRGALVVANADQGLIGQASASSYDVTSRGLRTVTGPVGDLRSEVCWIVLSKDGEHAYATNFGDGTISRYDVAPNGHLTLAQSVAATTTPGEKSVRDAGLTRGGHYLYAIDVTSQRIHGWSVNRDGGLTPIGSFPGLPSTAAGIATS